MYSKFSSIWEQRFQTNPSNKIEKLGFATDIYIALDDSNSVRNIQCVVVFAQSYVALLQSPGSDEGIDLLAFDVVKLSDSSFNLTLVWLNVDNKNKRVAIFNKFHRRFGSERVLDHGERVEPSLLWGALSFILWLPGGLQSLGLVEVDLGVDASSLLWDTLLQSIRYRRCLACDFTIFTRERSVQFQKRLFAKLEWSAARDALLISTTRFIFHLSYLPLLIFIYLSEQGLK